MVDKVNIVKCLLVLFFMFILSFDCESEVANDKVLEKIESLNKENTSLSFVFNIYKSLLIYIEDEKNIYVMQGSKLINIDNSLLDMENKTDIKKFKKFSSAMIDTEISCIYLSAKEAVPYDLVYEIYLLILNNLKEAKKDEVLPAYLLSPEYIEGKRFHLKKNKEKKGSALDM